MDVSYNHEHIMISWYNTNNIWKWFNWKCLRGHLFPQIFRGTLWISFDKKFVAHMQQRIDTYAIWSQFKPKLSRHEGLTQRHRLRFYSSTHLKSDTPRIRHHNTIMTIMTIHYRTWVLGKKPKTSKAFNRKEPARSILWQDLTPRLVLRIDIT